MPNCAQTVSGLRITWLQLVRLSAAIAVWLGAYADKLPGYTLLRPQLNPSQNHSYFAYLTAVIQQLIPTIHTLNKDYKKFFTNNLLLITGKVVHT